MLNEKEKSELIEKIRLLKKEIAELRKKFGEFNRQKEFWFRKKEELKEKINQLIKNIKDIKVQNDKSHENIKFLKEQRNKYNSEVKNLIKIIKKLNNEKRYAFKKYKIKADPSQIQKKIEDIEKRLETEVNFENEKRLMKEINRLKNAYEESRKIRDILNNINRLSNEITESKKKADEFHGKIEEYQQNKESYSDFIELSKEINETRKEEESAFQKFIDFKKQFIATNKLIREKNEEANKIGEILDRDKNEKKSKKEEATRNIILEKTKMIWEKFRSKKKLTREDLLVLQDKGKNV